MKEAVTIEGIEALRDLMKNMEPNLQRRVAKRGINKAAAKMRTFLKREARSMGGTGTLAKSIGKFKRRTGDKATARIGLNKNYFYKTLEFGDFTRKGHHFKDPLRPFFEKTVENHAKEVLQIIIDETTKSMFEEWGKASYKK